MTRTEDNTRTGQAPEHKPFEIKLPELCLVLLIGASGSGKSTFAARHFAPTEILSSDFFRGMVSDDANNQRATRDAFELLHHALELRLKNERLTVIDATNVQRESRKRLLQIAREYHVMTHAIVLDLPAALCHERNSTRPDRDFGPHVVKNHCRALKRSLRGLKREGIRGVYRLDSSQKIDAVEISRAKLWNNRAELTGPFDFIGDVHGCFEELVELLEALGWRISPAEGEHRFDVHHPEGRRAVFVGDLVDRGPATPEVLGLVMDMVAQSAALCVAGNHDVKLARALRGKKVTAKHGLAESLEQLDRCSPEFRDRAARFLDGLISHYMLDGGRLCVAHAGLPAHMQGRASGTVRSFALYGDTDGERDEYGLPIRHDWAADYAGETRVIYGHTPVSTPTWRSKTMCLDTGCVFGESLSALRWPEDDIVQVKAKRQYALPGRPIGAPEPARDDVLDVKDVTGKRVLSTRLVERVGVSAEHSAAALETMSRFAVDPRWLVYLPPTMSPSKTSKRDGLLEHPEDAIKEFASWGVEQLVAQVKHMGSRAVAIVTREDHVAVTRFGLDEPAPGIIYTRTGRPFFSGTDREEGDVVLGAIRAAMERAGLWDALETDWICLDAELMPWSAKARELLRGQYAAIAAAAETSLPHVLSALERAASRGVDVSALETRSRRQLARVASFRQTYRGYCWPVEGPLDLKFAPFHLLAAEGRAFFDRDHVWHMETLQKLCEADDSGILFVTEHKVIDTSSPEDVASLVGWWEELTSAGGEGLVLKPRDFVSRTERGHVIQPAMKCRGKEYLRLIYGPDYDEPIHLERLRERGLRRKRSMATREFALGVDALEKFAAGENPRLVHERVFGILATESEPVDPRF